MSELTLLLDAAGTRTTAPGLRVMGSEALPVENRHHFFAYASRVMRSVIVDDARARAAERTVRRDWEKARLLRLAAMG